MIRGKKVIIKIFTIAVFITIITFYIVHNISIKPKLVFKCSLTDAIEKCPDIGIWVREHNSWQFIPDEYISKIYDNEVDDDVFLLGTYEVEIIDFNPNCFNSTYGDIIKTKGETTTIYIYKWKKKYEPNLM